MSAETPWHYLRPNARCTVPRRLVCFDTEAHVAPRDGGTSQTFRLAVSSFDRLRDGHGHRPSTEWGEHRSPLELWRWVDARCASGETTWGYAHNLGYDLMVSRAFQELPALGWDLVAFGGHRGATWLRWRRGRRRLILADLGSWLPWPLEDVGRALGLLKLPLPRPRAPEETWWAYCRQDVVILREAVLHLMRWVREADLGSWRLTAAGQALAAYRHRFLRRRLLVHRDPGALALERAAYFGGRCEVLRHGPQEGGPFSYLDHVAQYCTIAGAVDLPERLVGMAGEGSIDRLANLASWLGVIAEVEVTTDLPLVPARTPLGTCWPVGTFRTALPWPEVALLLEHGAEVRPLRSAWYRMGPVLQEWAEWVLDRLYGPEAEADPLVRDVVKTWSRALVGKCGQTGRLRELVAVDPDGFTGAGKVRLEGEARARDALWINGECWMARDGAEPPNSLPALAAYVTSYGRVQLWRTMASAGADHILYVDTDGLITDPAGADRLAWTQGTGRPGSLSLRGSYSAVTCYLAQDIELDGRPEIKGIPRRSPRTGPRTYHVTTWPGMAWHLGRGITGRYLTTSGAVVLQAPYRRGWMVRGGRVLPLELEIVGGENRVVPWSRTRWRARGERLAERRQARDLAGPERR